jgi:two-component system sensor histidine kinase HydH
LEGILTEYLSFSRPLVELRSEPVALGPLVRDVAAVLEARAETGGITLSARGEAAVVGDPRRLKEALLNLVSNAIEATPRAGSVGIVVEAQGAGAEVRIEDTGRGLAAAELERVGTPFYTTRAEGTGLGVVLARTVIVQHGGEMNYQSIVGRGTTVRVTLPARPLAQPV